MATKSSIPPSSTANLQTSSSGGNYSKNRLLLIQRTKAIYESTLKDPTDKTKSWDVTFLVAQSIDKYSDADLQGRIALIFRLCLVRSSEEEVNNLLTKMNTDNSMSPLKEFAKKHFPDLFIKKTSSAVVTTSSQAQPSLSVQDQIIEKAKKAYQDFLGQALTTTSSSQTWDSILAQVQDMKTADDLLAEKSPVWVFRKAIYGTTDEERQKFLDEHTNHTMDDFAKWAEKVVKRKRIPSPNSASKELKVEEREKTRKERVELLQRFIKKAKERSDSPFFSINAQKFIGDCFEYSKSGHAIQTLAGDIDKVCFSLSKLKNKQLKVLMEILEGQTEVITNTKVENYKQDILKHPLVEDGRVFGACYKIHCLEFSKFYEKVKAGNHDIQKFVRVYQDFVGRFLSIGGLLDFVDIFLTQFKKLNDSSDKALDFFSTVVKHHELYKDPIDLLNNINSIIGHFSEWKSYGNILQQDIYLAYLKKHKLSSVAAAVKSFTSYADNQYRYSSPLFFDIGHTVYQKHLALSKSEAQTKMKARLLEPGITQSSVLIAPANLLEEAIALVLYAHCVQIDAFLNNPSAQSLGALSYYFRKSHPFSSKIQGIKFLQATDANQPSEKDWLGLEIAFVKENGRLKITHCFPIS